MSEDREYAPNANFNSSNTSVQQPMMFTTQAVPQQ